MVSISEAFSQIGDDVGVTVANVRAICTAPEGRPLVIVKVDTSDSGLYGVGCATFTQRPLAVVTAVEDYLRPLLVGRRVGDIEDIFQTVYLSSYWRQGPVLNNAMAGVDVALWDIKGKVAGLPLYELFGGRCRPGAVLYAHASGHSFAEVEEAARGFIQDGYRYVRCQIAVPGADTYGVKDGAPEGGFWDPGAYRRIVPKLFDHLRENVGEEVELLHDVHERLNPIEALALAKDVEAHKLFFLEDPLAPEDADYLKLLRQHTVTPIALGELFVNRAEYVPLIRERLLDFLRTRISSLGGLTLARKVAPFCEMMGVRTAWHGPGDVSPVGHAANLHLEIASPNFGIHEGHTFGDEARAVFPGMPEIRDGVLWPNDQAGLGIDLDEQQAAEHPLPSDELNGSWPPIRRADGSIVRP